MVRMILFLGLVLAGCNSAPGYFGQSDVTRLEVNGSVFDIRVRDEAALAVRVNPEFFPEGAEVRPKARVAMQKVSGCQVEHVLGDNNMILGLMDCDGVKRDWSKVLKAAKATSYTCYDIGTLSRKGPGGYTTFQCDPY